MSSGGISPRNAQEVQEFFEREKEAQQYMDRFYLMRGHEIETRKGNRKRDLVLLLGGTRRQRIEEKFRFNTKDLSDAIFTKDLLIEIVQDLASGNVGWFSETGCDYLHYIFCDGDNVPYRLYRIKWKDGFQEWFCEYLTTHKRLQAIISTRGYGLTINLPCDWDLIPGDLVSVEEIPAEVCNPIIRDMDF